MTKERKKLKRAVALLSIISLLDFLFYYIVTLTLGSYTFAIYTVFFVGKLVSFALPVITGAILLVEGGKLRESILRVLILSLPRLIYYIPYFYLDYVYDVFDSIESLALSILTSALAITVLSLAAFICYLIMAAAKKKFAKHEESQLYPLPLFNLENEAALGIFFASLSIFALSFAAEIYDTVSFFIEIGSRYRTGEIIFIVGKYAFLVFSLVFTHFISCFAANKLMQKQSSGGESEKQAEPTE